MAKVQIVRGGQKGVVPMVGGKVSKTKLIGNKKPPAQAGGGGGGGGN